MVVVRVAGWVLKRCAGCAVLVRSGLVEATCSYLDTSSVSSCLLR